MAFKSEWINRLRHLFLRPSRFDDEFDDEVRFHMDSRIEELQATGLSPSDALARARREFGPVARAGEESRAAWKFTWVEDLVSDLRYAIRSFRRSPAFTITAVLSLALGIGANSAIFNALYTILFKPLPVSDPDSLVSLSIWSAKRPRGGDVPLDFISQFRRANLFQGLAITS